MKKYLKKIFQKINQTIYIFYIRNLKMYLRLSSYPFISGDTLRKYSDHVLDETSNLKIDKIKKGDLVFVKTDYLKTFFIELMPKINNNFKLVTHNSDINIDFDMKKFVKNKDLEWYAQNLTFVPDSSDKIFPIPIGVENKHYFKNGILSHFDIKDIKKEYEILCSFNINTNKKRIEVLNAIKSSENINFLRYSNHKEYIRELSKHKFNICPEGNGVDTHRFWESLIVETIPVVLKSEFIENFKRYEIPMLCLNSWKDLNKISKNELNSFYETNISNLKFKKFVEFDFWIDQINNK
tara:strand:+ start:1669 stop:2553 length:885 start_codon:yes stop_codon:yes gene_type:complete